MTQTVELKVRMSCLGCSGAVRRKIEKMEGVASYDIDMDKQKVTVIGNVDPQLVFEYISKTGKETSFWVEPEAPAAAGEPESKPTETVSLAPPEPESKPTEDVAVASVVPESKPTEAVAVASIESESKPTEAVAVATKPAEAVASA